MQGSLQRSAADCTVRNAQASARALIAVQPRPNAQPPPPPCSQPHMTALESAFTTKTRFSSAQPRANEGVHSAALSYFYGAVGGKLFI